MKKLPLFLMALCLVFLIAGCGSGDSSSSSKPSSSAASTSKKAEQSKTSKPRTKKSESSAKSKPKATKATKATEESRTEATTESAEAQTTSTDEIKIVLDPGHDSGEHRRDHANLGVSEQDLNLAIGLACRDRLNKYSGIKVYMTREDGTCPNASGKYNTNGEYEDCILARTSYASTVGADLYVSLHCNASTGELNDSGGGAEVYVSNYPEFKQKYTPLGQKILNNITSRLDITSRGVLTREKPEKGCYKDGTVKDYYYLISNNVDVGRPSIIVEHAFMDTYHDNAILKDKNNLKTLGEADADAIAEFYGLKLKQ